MEINEVAHPQSGSSSTIPSQIQIWKSWFLRRRRNRRTWRKTSHTLPPDNSWIILHFWQTAYLPLP